MKAFLFRRFLSTLPVLFGVATLVFLLLHVIPGDPVALMLGDYATPEDLAQTRTRLGLNDPLLVQYGNFWLGIFNGTWGHSFSYDAPVLDLILERFGSTVYLALSSLGFAICLSFSLGVYSASRRHSWADHVATLWALLGLSLPIFVVAPIAVLVFSIYLRWLPVAGSESWLHLVLPSLCLGFGLTGILTRMVRSCMLEILGEDFVRTARAKGLHERVILWRHVLRNALLPVMTLLGNMLGGLFAGALITETLFDWPGIGRLFYSGVQQRDYPLIQGGVIWVALCYVLINALVDIAYALVDPRIRIFSDES